MNIYFICVIVHVQMWCVCAQPYMDQTKKIFVLLVYFWKWFVSPMFFKVFQVIFVWKTCFLGIFMTHFICKLNWELNDPILKFFQLWTESFATVLRVAREYFHMSASRENFQIRFLKGISWVICFNRLSSSPKPLFNVSKSKPN